MGEDEIKAVSAANQVENYNLKRVLKIKNDKTKDENNYILHYEHKKQGRNLFVLLILIMKILILPIEFRPKMIMGFLMP